MPGANRGNYQLSATITQLIYDGGHWWNGDASRQARPKKRTRVCSKSSRLVGELEAISRFYTLLNAQVALEVFDNSVRHSQTQLDRASTLFEAARAPKLDAIDAEVNLGNDRINVLKQRQAILSAQVARLKWLGNESKPIEAVDPGTLAPKATPLPAPPVELAMAQAKKTRPLLKALDAQLRAAQKGVDLQWSQYFPQVSLQGGYQRQSPSPDPFFTDITQQNVVFGGVVLNWNAFSGFGTQAQVIQARESVIQAQLTSDRATTDLEGDLRRALEALNTNIEVADISAANLRLSQSALSLAEQRFAAGAGSTLEVRDAQVKLTAAQLSQVQARVDVEVARAGVRRVIGADVENGK